MPLKMLQIIAPTAAENNIKKLVSETSVISFYKGALLEDDHALYTLLTRAEDRQQLIDKLHDILQTSSKARINILPVDATLPTVESRISGDTREELYQKVGHGAQLNFTYLLLTFLSTIVCLIGLLQDNVAVVVGAMVIAPFLGPNLAFAFATSLGDKDLMKKSFICGTIGMSLAIIISAGVGALNGSVPTSVELISRTEVGISGVALAAASGVAGVLSLTTGLSMTLVGVMVAVALLPPAATFGYMLGASYMKEASGAFLLLSVNIVCVNLAGLLVFLGQGIQPRLWFERKMAKPFVLAGILVWSVALIVLVSFIGFYNLVDL
ncbi:TIGR00341 family protein [Kordiimonas pumila]|uniref:TIGR00341 family protein n=1 Tax=Kordiimonas pumila TaxID=2161677 RepID=A0ABV7D9X5_9PROT|nr:TIGR00341 family protein [Kordiimonas pumila]